MTLELRLAARTDAAAISRLLVANSAANGGTLYGDWSEAVVRTWIETGTPIVVAIDGEQVKGVLFSAENADGAAAPVKAMFAACPAIDDAYAYGPICVDASMRGQGLPKALYARLAECMGERRGLLFINRSNVGSLKAHQKMGMDVVAQFQIGEQLFDVLQTPAG